MHKVTFNCEVITPMFVSGADNSRVEIRPPSVKGLIRYWWRAMHGELGLDDLKKREGSIFGSVDTGGRRSKVLLRIDKQPRKGDIGFNLWDEIPHQDTGKFKRPTVYHGIAYLLYSVLMINRRPYIKPGFGFSLEISSRDEMMLREAVHAFWCLSFLGAVGSRCRRGAGCMRVTTEHPQYKQMFDTTFVKDKSRLKQFLESGIAGFDLQPGTSAFSVLKGSIIYILDPRDNWKDALESTGGPFRDFRHNIKSRISDTPNFGFPIRHRDKTLMGAGPQKVSKDSRGNVKGFLNRRSSPLVIKVLKTGEDCFFPVIVWLKGDLVPKSYRIMDRQGGNIAQPNNNLINQFLGSFKNKLVIQV